jgi:hypothetical protein
MTKSRKMTWEERVTDIERRGMRVKLWWGKSEGKKTNADSRRILKLIFER